MCNDKINSSAWWHSLFIDCLCAQLLSCTDFSRRHHDVNQKTRQFRGCVRVGFLRPHGTQHGGAEWSHVAAFDGVHWRQRCLGRARWVTRRPTGFRYNEWWHLESSRWSEFFAKQTSPCSFVEQCVSSLSIKSCSSGKSPWDVTEATIFVHPVFLFFIIFKSYPLPNICSANQLQQ